MNTESELEDLKVMFDSTALRLEENKGRWQSIAETAEGKIEDLKAFEEDLPEWIENAVQAKVDNIKDDIEDRVNELESWVDDLDEAVSSFSGTLNEKKIKICNDLESLPNNLVESINQLQAQSQSLMDDDIRDSLGGLLVDVESHFRQTLEHVYALPDDIGEYLLTLEQEVQRCEMALMESMHLRLVTMEGAGVFIEKLLTDTFGELKNNLAAFKEVKDVKDSLIQTQKKIKRTVDNVKELSAVLGGKTQEVGGLVEQAIDVLVGAIS